MKIRPFDFAVIEEKPTIADGHYSPLFNDNKKPKEKTYSKNELEIKEQEAYQKGLSEGEQKGFDKGKNISDQEQQKIDQNLAQVLGELTPKLNSFFEGYEQKINASKDDNAKLVIAISKKITSKEADEDIIKNIEELILKCSNFIFDEPKITLTLNDNIVKTAKEKIEIIFKNKNYSGSLDIISNSEIPLTDCKIQWAEGAIETNKQEIWSNIESLLENNS